MQRANESHCSTPVHFTHVLLRCHRLAVEVWHCELTQAQSGTVMRIWLHSAVVLRSKHSQHTKLPTQRIFPCPTQAHALS